MNVKPGDVVKIYSWHGVVQDVFTSAGGTVLKMRFVKNLFFGQESELIELVDEIEIAPATVEDLRGEIRSRARYQQNEIDRFLTVAERRLK